MAPPDGVHDVIERSIAEVERARKRVARGASKQVTRVDEIDYLKSVAYAWFKSHRLVVAPAAPTEAVNMVDAAFQKIMTATVRHAARSTYVDELHAAKKALSTLRATSLVSSVLVVTSESPPNFSGLASDAVMRAILVRRWEECQKCLRVGAHLAATVMMGGLLEALFVAKANQMTDKSRLFKAKATPLDPKTRKPLALTEWTLRPYIDVGAEIGWITQSGRDVAAVLRDYRNYVHPEKERAHGIVLNDHDSSMLWEVSKSLARQLLASV
jgi:hypothetical protein